MLPARRRSSVSVLTALLALLAGGCGATTLRVSASPTLDSGGEVGFEAGLSFGLGSPLDFKGRSHHFAQARATLGGGVDGRSAQGVIFAGGEIDYIYWAEPTLDARIGLHGLYRHLPEASAGADGGAFGAHVGLLPAVLADPGGWLASQLLLGPEIRVEHVWGAEPNSGRAQVSLPLVLEGTFLGAGD